MDNLKLLIVSTSTVHGMGYLEYIQDEITDFFQGCQNIVFVPYARPGGATWDEYTNVARNKFAELGLSIKGIHEYGSVQEAIDAADGFFTGGGNTFELLNEIYTLEVMEPLNAAVRSGKPYMGTSAGSNITGLTIGTSNDMPIVYPPSFTAFGWIPFNLNPHYLDPDPGSKHMGETRETRIKEFHFYNDQMVLGLREGSWLRMENGNLELKGPLQARVFEKNKAPYEIDSGEVNWMLGS